MRNPWRAQHYRVAVGITVTLIVIVALTIHYWSASAPPAAALPLDRSGEAESRPLPTVGPQLDASIERGDRTRIDGSCRLMVKSIAGTPIAGAQLRSVPIGTAVTLPEEPLTTSRDLSSDASGCISFPRGLSSHPMRHRAWVVSASGFRPKEVVLGDQQELEVILEFGHAISVQCRDGHGEPIAGVAIAITRNKDQSIAKQSIRAMRLSKLTRLQSELGSDLATYVATTDSQGLTCFDSLTPGIYYVEIDSPRYVRTEYDGRLKVTSPGELLVRLGEVFCAVLKMEPSERIISWQAVRPPAPSGINAQQAYSGPPFWALREKYPNCCVFTSVGGATEPPVASVSMFIAGYGRYDKNISLVPISMFDGPELIQLPEGEVKNCVRIVWVTEPALRAYGDVRPPRILLTGSRNGVSFTIIAVYGEPTLVPLGHIEIEPETTAMRDAMEIPRNLDLGVADTRLVWKLTRPLVPCRVVVEPATSVIGCLDTVTVSCNGKESAYVANYVPEEDAYWQNGVQNLWVPPGDIEVSVRRRNSRVVFRAAKNDQGCVILCDVTSIIGR